MAPTALELENHTRDADFNKALHGKSAQERGGLMAMMRKGAEAQKMSVEEYYKHWESQQTQEDTPEIREVSFVEASP